MESIEKKYRIGQTVFVRILQLDEEKHRCIVSLKSLVYDGEISELVQPDFVLRTYLDEKYQLIEDMKRSGTGPLSKFFQETNQWIGYQCRCLIEKRLDQWFIGRLENGLPASLPYDAHYSIGDSVQGHIIDYNVATQQFIVTLDLKKSIKHSIDPSETLEQCLVLCQLSSYALAITQPSNALIHLPTFKDLNNFYSSSPNVSYQHKQQVNLTSLTPHISEQYPYIIFPSPSKQLSIEIYPVDGMQAVTIIDVLPKQLNVKLNDGSRGRIHITELWDQFSPEKFQSLNDHYQVNQILNARIIGTRNIEKDSKHQRPVYELSLREKSPNSFEIGDRVLAFLDKIDEKNKGYWFHLSLHIRGYVPAEFLSKQLNIGQCSYVTILNKTKTEKGEHYTLSMFENNTQTESKIVYAQFREIKSANEFHFNVKRHDEIYQGILFATDVSDMFEDFICWNYLFNAKSPLLVNGQLNTKKELWKFRNKTIRAVIKEEDLEKKQLILSTRKSRFV